MQEEGPCLTPKSRPPLRISRILRPEDANDEDERISLGRVVLWVIVWVGLLVGIALYFKYARLLPPLLG
ncbi:MAG: hypothetical protein ABI625_24595 [bacterium]